MPAQPLFPLGHVLITPGAAAALESARQFAWVFVGLHAAGRWGDLCDEDKALNDQAVHSGGRIFSAYRLSDGTKVWVITEADRHATTVLLPSEY